MTDKPKPMALPRPTAGSQENAARKGALAFAAKMSKADRLLRKFSWEKDDG